MQLCWKAVVITLWSLIINKIKTIVVMLTEIFSHSILCFICLRFPPSFCAKFQRHYIQKPFLFLYLCTTQQIANVSGKEWAQLSLHHHHTQPFLPFFFSSRKRKGTGGQKQRGQKRNVRDEREQRKLPRLQQHSFSVRHLLFYCNLMALLSPGASRQSPLYHMAIISVALLCDSLTLSTVTCDPL